MAKNEGKFQEALKDKKIPVLTLDQKFHELTDVIGTSAEIERLKNNLNDLLKAQGKANTEIKEVRNIKKRLMTEIIENSDEHSPLSENQKIKKAEENKRLIQECNEKIAQYEDDILDLPVLIDEANKTLMASLMEVCSSRLDDNNKNIQETANWISQMRVELKKRLVRKTDMETANQKIYEYMHDIFGPEVIEIFDMTYKDTILK